MLITEAIKSVLASDPAIMGMLPGRFSLTFRKEKGLWPYLIVQQKSNQVTEFQSERIYKTEAVVLVKVHTESARNEEQANRIIEAVHWKLLSTQPLPFDATGRCQGLWPMQDPIVGMEPANDRAPDAGSVCTGSATYKAEIWRSFP